MGGPDEQPEDNSEDQRITRIRHALNPNAEAWEGPDPQQVKEDVLWLLADYERLTKAIPAREERMAQRDEVVVLTSGFASENSAEEAVEEAAKAIGDDSTVNRRG